MAASLHLNSQNQGADATPVSKDPELMLPQHTNRVSQKLP
jgi:hypothetical protein